MNKKNISVTLIAGVAICTSSTNLFAQDQNARVNPVVMVNQFEATSGKFEGYRRSGAKGICAIGEFRGSPSGREISTASAFSGNPIKVIVRFSVGGANPKAADNTKSQRNLSLEFNLLYDSK
jgi:catalase